MTVGALTACPAGADDSVIAAAQGQALAVGAEGDEGPLPSQALRPGSQQCSPVLPVARKARTGSRRTSPRQAFHAAFYGK